MLKETVWVDWETMNDTVMYPRNEGRWDDVLDEPPAPALTDPKNPGPAVQSGDKRPAPCRVHPKVEAFDRPCRGGVIADRNLF